MYVRNKLKGVCHVRDPLLLRRSGDASTDDGARSAADADPAVDGILLQLPLPAGLDARVLLQRVDPAKDVDGLHPTNLGKLVAEDDTGFHPCTPAGVVELLRRYDIATEGRRVVIVGRSSLVGKPLALLLMRRAPGGNATVTVVHTRSRDVPARLAEAEIVVAAAGSAGFVRGEWLRPGAVVIDVGIHRTPTRQLVGDVDFASASLVASAITPVPGGVGPMTVAMLMRNTTLAWRRNERI
jgi:methylenetetrahydrofolate dehydrogenase (NADP+)/methenyltetrahydrofolate cyclohydrolase